ncbi:MAG: divalent metal cation transporter [Minisyncoccia bacterium]|jgi:NRAMP (natural resistance-associated macrophage protein)-like metal ion transporter
MIEELKKQKKKSHWLPRIFRILGPGLITGAADDDPSGIATYSQTGAQFGYGQLWAAVFLYPFMTAVQEACARIGAVTKKGIAQVIRENYSKKILVGAVALILVANTVNIGADIGAMASAVRLVVPVPFVVITLLFTALMLLLEIWISYKTYARILKWLAATLLVYPMVIFLVHEPWREIFAATFLPHISFSFAFLFILVGVAGTTISPYMFFWQASEEVEEEIKDGIDKKPGISKAFIRNMRIDNAIGMFISEFVTWCIIIATATVLHASGVTNIGTASDAARALAPLVHSFPNAGFLAELIFAIGIVGLGLLAVPVLAGSAAYALSEAFSWHEGLYRKFRKAHGFYGVITVATLIGLLINFVGIDPIKALIITAVLNGVVAVPLIAIIATVSSSRKIMGEHRSGWLSRIFLWLTFVLMFAAAVGMFVTFR